MKAKRILVLLSAVLLLLTACGGGTAVIAEKLEGRSGLERLIQQPASFLNKKAEIHDPEESTVEKITAAEVEAYMQLLTEEYGLVKYYEELGYVYNTYYFVHPDRLDQTGEYGRGSDVYLFYVFDSDFSSDYLTVELNEEHYVFGDVGYRYEGKQYAPINGPRACDAFLKQGKYYVNSSDGLLKVRAGVRKDYTYLYTKPFASQAYGYYTKRGTATLLINGEVMNDCIALIGDFESFHSNDSDILTVYHPDSAANISITWQHKLFKAGEVYDLCNFHESGLCAFDFDYDYNEFDEANASCITVRPLVIDRDGEQDSVVYFYAEFENGDGEHYTLEGLVAAPFGLAHQSKAYTGTSTGGKSNGGGVVTVSTFIPEHSKLDCLTCGGDGDCNSCGGSGYDYYGSYRTTCNTCNGSGNCRSCSGSGKR